MKTVHALLLIPILSIFFLLPDSNAIAQHAFQEMFPGLVPAQRHASVQTPDGGFCILAREATPDGYNSRFVLIKTNTDGLVEWSRIISTPASNDYPTSLHPTGDGGFYALGSTSIPSEWDQDILLIRLSAHGDPLWSKTYSNSMLDWASDITVLPDGSAVIVGSTQVSDTVWYTDAKADGYYDSFSGEEGNTYYSAESDEVSEYDSEEENYVDYGPDYYLTERESAFLLRIDQDGEAMWGRALPNQQAQQRTDEGWTSRSFGETVCVRDEETVSVVVESLNFNLWMSMILDISSSGVAKQATQISTWDSTSPFHFSTLANDIAALPNGGLAIAGSTGVFPNFSDASFLAILDNTNKLTQLRSYLGNTENDLIYPSLIPVEDGFLVSGMKQDEDTYYTTNPMIARLDKSGAVVEAHRWIISSDNFSLSHTTDEASVTKLWHPLFSLTDDQGILSVATILTTNTEDYSVPDQQSLLITRFTPDITTCGDKSTETVDRESILRTEDYVADKDFAGYYTYQGDYQSAWGYDGSVNAVPGDFRTYVVEDMIAIDVPEMMTESVPSPDYEYSAPIVPTINMDYQDPAPATEHHSYEPTLDTVLIAAMPTAIDFDTLYANPPTTTYWEVSDTAATYVYSEEYDDEIELGSHESLIPTFTKQEISLIELSVTTQTLHKVTAEDFDAEPIILCQENTMISASAGNEESQPTESEYLHLLPNTIRTGKAVSAEFSLMGKEKPEVSIINIARGEVVRQAGSKNVTWSSSNGKGTAAVETAGLTTGTYLVRVRSGEKQLTAKLEVQ